MLHKKRWQYYTFSLALFEHSAIFLGNLFVMRILCEFCANLCELCESMRIRTCEACMRSELAQTRFCANVVIPAFFEMLL